MLIHFALEGHLIHMSRADYDELTLGDVDGPNSDALKASLLRSFPLPQRFITDNSLKTEEPRTVNILGGFVSKEDAWLVVDYIRLSKLHVISRAKAWTKQDLSTESPVSLN